MKNTFLLWKKKHDEATLQPFSTDSVGQLWLKTKSIVRSELINEFITQNNLTIVSKNLAKQFEELFNILQKNVKNSHIMLDEYIKAKNKFKLKELNTKKLVSELYKLKVFEWGGDHKNSLDKYLVSRYIKTISSYDELLSKFDTEINHTVKGYMLNSWYNHWSSILIEYIFKSHESVLPTVGQIKNVDFFINNIPFDLKVTYFPAEYLKLKRKEKGLPVELTYLKSKARELGIFYDKQASASDVYYEIIEKMKDRRDNTCKTVLAKLKSENMNIVKETQVNTKQLSKWLYENQGEMRFGSENRLFLVLVDTDEFASSWKLKRNIELLRPNIYNFLNRFKKKSIKDLEIAFNYPGKQDTFHCLADVIFVVK